MLLEKWVTAVNELKSSFNSSDLLLFWIGLQKENLRWKWVDGNYYGGAKANKDLQRANAMYAALYLNEKDKIVDWMGLTKKEAEGSSKYIDAYQYKYGYICETRGIYTLSTLITLCYSISTNVVKTFE